MASMINTELVRNLDLAEITSASPLWEWNPDGYWEATIYPNGNFATYPTSQGVPLKLRTAEKLDVKLLTVVPHPIGRTKPEQDMDYLLNPHLFIPQEGLFVTDGHRYLIAAYHLMKEMAVTPQSVLTIDLDYFVRIANHRIEKEVRRLIAAAVAARTRANVVVADSHEDLGFSFDGKLRNPPLSLEESVKRINSGEIHDGNCLSALLPGTKICLLKPPLIEQFPSSRVDGFLEVRTADQLAADLTVQPGLRAFDLVHICTSPTCLDPGRAFSLLKLIHEVGFVPSPNS